MSDLLIEVLKVGGLSIAVLLTFAVVYATAVGMFRAFTGESARIKDSEARAWIAGWNAAMDGDQADEWAKRFLESELGDN